MVYENYTYRVLNTTYRLYLSVLKDITYSTEYTRRCEHQNFQRGACLQV